ncbi:hypothetical protein K438DRAFT_1777935 [Mycena galopus ATCC 62051]|nr:hypothetical protein K438DRAFT_1777935 [Mycena galopus ATCC 62051]
MLASFNENVDGYRKFGQWNEKEQGRIYPETRPDLIFKATVHNHILRQFVKIIYHACEHAVQTGDAGGDHDVAALDTLDAGGQILCADTFGLDTSEGSASEEERKSLMRTDSLQGMYIGERRHDVHSTIWQIKVQSEDTEGDWLQHRQPVVVCAVRLGVVKTEFGYVQCVGRGFYARSRYGRTLEQVKLEQVRQPAKVIQPDIRQPAKVIQPDLREMNLGCTEMLEACEVPEALEQRVQQNIWGICGKSPFRISVRSRTNAEKPDQWCYFWGTQELEVLQAAVHFRGRGKK